MDSRRLERLFSYLEYISLEEQRYLLYRDRELFDSETYTSRYFDSWDEALDAGLHSGRTVSEALDRIQFIELRGGRGASSEMGGGFTTAGDGDMRDPEYGKILYPAEFNRQGRFASQARAIDMFTEKYGNSDREYGVSIDEQGFVHRHIQGGKTSVPIRTAGENHMIVHNHPSGGAFSKADLQAVSSDRRAKGIVATSSGDRYALTKTHRFDAKGFSKAVESAKWPKHLSYSDGADWWLKRNAKKYGYDYSRRVK